MRQTTPTPTTNPTPTESPQSHGSPDAEGDALPVSEQVVAVVATVTGADPTEMEPLYRSVDADSLDRLFAGSDPTLDGCVAFTFGGCDVIVRDDETVAVTPPGEREPAWDTATDAVPSLTT